MSQFTSPPAQIVADTIIRTVELGVRITDAALTEQTTVLWCDLLVEDPGRCPGCGLVGTYRDSIERRVSDVPVVGHPLQLRVRVPRYRGVHDGCGREVFAHDTSRLARPGASTTRRSTVVLGMAVGKDVEVNDEGLQSAATDAAAAGRFAAALQPDAIDALLAEAHAAGTPINGVDGLLNQMTKAALERALQGETAHHLGYERDDPAGNGSGNSRNGASTKTVSTTNGPVTIRVPRDRNGDFEPRIVPKRKRRVGQIDELVLSCCARGMSTRDIETHLGEVYGVNTSREMMSNITDIVTAEIELWRNRPVDEVYPIVYVDGIRLKIRDKGGGDDQGRLPGGGRRPRGPQARPRGVDRRV